MRDTLIIGRDREIAQLELAIGPGNDGLRLAMLSGPSGLGKTTLARHAADRAADRGFRVARINGRAGSLSTPLAPFIEAMPEFELLLAVLAADSSVDTDHAGIGLVNLLAELTIDQPLLLCFDDAQALDETSIALLPYLVGVSERMQLTLLFIEQTDAVGIPSSYRSFIDGVLARRVVSHLALGPMADASIRELVAHVLELEDTNDVAPAIVERAQGNPWFAKELAEAFRAGATEIPTTIAAAATARLHTLDEVGQDLVSAIALCDEGAHVGWLETMSGERPRQFVRTIENVVASGLVREDGDLLSIAHPLMQQALVGELSSAMRRAIHLELAEVIASTPMPDVVAARARGRHLAAAGRPGEAVDEYLRAATANEVQGQLHEAYADLCRALESEPSLDARVQLLTRCATMAMQLGMRDAITHWTELGRLAAARDDNELYAYALFQQYWACNDGTANERLQRAATLGHDRYGWSARAAATLARMDANFVDAMEHDRRAIEVARRNGDTLLEVLALQKLANSLADSGRTGEAIETYRQAIHQAISHRHHDWAADIWKDLVETQVDELQTHDALVEARAAEQYVNDLRLDRMLPATLTWKAYALMQLGELESSLEVIDHALQTDLGYRTDPAYRRDHFGAVILLVRAQVAVEAGLPDAVERTRVAAEMLLELGYASWLAECDVALARAIARRDGIAASLIVLENVERYEEPTFSASVALWLVRAGVQAGHDGAVARARQLLGHLEGATLCPRAQLSVDEIRVTLAVLDGAPVTDLDAIALRWSDASRVLDALRTGATAGAVALQRGDREAAKAYLHAAKTGFATCGADHDADVVAALLRQTGARSRAKSRTTNVGPLTRRELEIARLVASGLKNSEVASTLFLAEKTVAAHLSNIYGKVEVRSRVQLTAWIRENDPEFESAAAAAS